eukprot:4031759-Prymnesium_polylepis.1
MREAIRGGGRTREGAGRGWWERRRARVRGSTQAAERARGGGAPRRARLRGSTQAAERARGQGADPRRGTRRTCRS